MPTVDGEFLPDEPNVLMETERVHQVDVLSGVVKDEGATQTGIPTPWSPNCIRPHLSPSKLKYRYFSPKGTAISSSYKKLN